MTDLLLQSIESLPEFLAHALELEIESAERYRDLADVMHVHNNPEVAELFRKLAAYGDRHAAEVQQRAAAYQLPVISPWDFKWSCPEPPESPCMADTHYLMTKCQALELALHNEVRGRDFYAAVAARTKDPAVRAAAAEMAAEEGGHVDMLRAWFARESCDTLAPPSDLDPPNMPE
jgi:rubrerythrin